MNRDVQRKQQIEALILKYEKTVYKLAYSYMKNRQDTDDVYQEVFLRFSGRNRSLKTRSMRKPGLSERRLIAVRAILCRGG